jgi:hypothetical protein
MYVQVFCLSQRSSGRLRLGHVSMSSVFVWGAPRSVRQMRGFMFFSLSCSRSVRIFCWLAHDGLFDDTLIILVKVVYFLGDFLGSRAIFLTLGSIVGMASVFFLSHDHCSFAIINTLGTYRAQHV